MHSRIHAHTQVIIGNQVTKLGEVKLGNNGGNASLVALVLGIVVLIGACVAFVMFRKQNKSSEKEKHDLKLKMNKLESDVAKVCKEGEREATASGARARVIFLLLSSIKCHLTSNGPPICGPPGLDTSVHESTS